MSTESAAAAVESEPMVPRPYRVAHRVVETHDSVTLHLTPLSTPLPRFRPGQFMMVYAHGIGEAAISISGDPSTQDNLVIHTIRAVGAVTAALHDTRPGAVIGLRGPYGTSWDIESAARHDLVVVAGGVGLAPLRSVVLGVLAARECYGRVTLIVGARTPAEFLYRGELDSWAARSDLDVELTIDQPAAGWDGPVGFVTEPLHRLHFDGGRTIAFLCGPEPMMRFSAQLLVDKGLAPTDIWLSLERNMKCGIALCGHCQLGPLLVCRDGPVVDYRVAPLLRIKEL